MPKNIVLLSDGTGNSSAKLFTTNVWRLYQVLDLRDPASQVAFYDNGVGTSSFKPFAMLGGVFGFGLKRNVIHLYRFLCRNYNEGDRIFGFGFSRGAFTMRIVTRLVARQGLVPYHRNAPNAEAKLARNAKAAYRQFREQFHTRSKIEGWLRKSLHWIRNLFNRAVPEKERIWPPIHFLGLWDTVDAYGGPIDEITTAIDNWIWPLKMPDRTMSNKIGRACHALALDDERRSFWPVLWEEDIVVDRNDEYRPIKENWSPPDDADIPKCVARPLLEIDEQRLSQVWFAGMHSDVGGGYPQNGLSYVTLDWMMDRAIVYQLRLKSEEVLWLRRCANEYDKLNDSRHGLGGYYRYHPRELATLYATPPEKPTIFEDIAYLRRTLKGLRAGSVYSPIIHESVFRHIDAGVDGYNPIVIPATYYVTTKSGQILPGPHRLDRQPGARAPGQERRVWNLVWVRRVVYFVTLLVSLALAATPLLLLWWPGNGEASWAAPLIPAIDVIGRFLPSFAAYWIDAFKQAPNWLFVGGVALAALLNLGGRLQRRIHDRMRPLWPGVNLDEHRNRVALLLSDCLYKIRSSKVYRGFFYTMTQWVLPLVCLVGIVYGLIAGTSRVLFAIEDSFGFVCTGSQKTEPANGQETPFATSTLCHPTGLTVENNHRYRITIEITEPWTDNGIPTDPNGFDRTRMTWKMWFGLPMRRLVMENWFQIVVRVGSRGQDEQVLPVEPVKADKDDKPGLGAAAPAPTVFAGTFTANNSGEVFLYVNDAVIGLPGLVDVFYANNAGEARVTIQPAP